MKLDSSISLDIYMDFFRDADGNILRNLDVETRFNRMAAALKSIALSYPETEEGETLAWQAREALS